MQNAIALRYSLKLVGDNDVNMVMIFLTTK